MAPIKVSRYNLYSEHLIRRYGEKVYKLPVNLPGSCPNRDGKLGTGGCAYCDEQGAGFEALSSDLSIEEQVAQNRIFFQKRYKAKKFIVYFQSFTNTYLPFGQFCANMEKAAQGEDIVGISVSTRPDCINDRYLDFLAGLRDEKKIDIYLELGLQTVNYRTLLSIKRAHTLAEFIDAAGRIRSRGLETCAHLILNLPGDEMVDAVENAKVLSALGVEYVKIHSLYIVKGTPFGEAYLRSEFEVTPLEEYLDRVVAFLEYLDPSIVIQRLVGRGPFDKSLFSNWGISWWQVKQKIESRLEELDTFQGRRFDYLNGRALR